MSSVSETLVREFFELQGFLVRQPRKHIGRSSREEDGGDLLVLNPQPAAVEDPLPFVLRAADLGYIARAVVIVRGWHTETFSPARLAAMPEIFAGLNAAFRQAGRALGGGGAVTRILVVPALPAAAEARRQSVDIMRANGVDAVLAFPTLLADLVNRVEANRDYAKSDLLQVLRILKNYELLREPQLELFRPRRSRREASAPEADGRADA